MAAVKIAAIVALIILFMRLRLSMGVALLISSMATGLLFMERIYDIPYTMFMSLKSPVTIKTIVIVYGVLLLSEVMRRKGLDRMIESLSKFIRDLRAAIIVPPALIGLLPMPGGAMLPAVIVDKMGDSLSISPEKKTYINYWFRHIWEYFWPLYPGLILTASISGVPIRSIMASQWYLSATAFAAGLIVLLMIPSVKSAPSKSHALKAVWNFIYSILPILAIILLIIFTKFDASIIVISVTAAYFILQRISWKEKGDILKKSFAVDSLLLIAGVMVFKDFLAESRALGSFIESIPKNGQTEMLLLVLFPMLIGFLTGVNQAYVGVVLPVVIPFIASSGSVDMSKLTLFYAAGFAGVLVSPVHLCLSLTKTYFKADFHKVYRYVVPSTIPILLIPLIIFLLKGR